MSFNPLTWKTRKLLVVLFWIIILHILFIYKRTHYVTYEAVVKNAKPKDVWEFVADFSNMKKLNPTIEHFNIVAESGNFDHWKYSVRYTEHLSHIPSIKNTAHGHYSVRQEQDGYLISSEHTTCFFFSDYGCVNSVSQFTFVHHGEGTKCQESVQYECPIAFSLLCHKEVMFQRQMIMEKLKEHFTVGQVSDIDEKVK